ncbi:MAG: transcriptional regulator [Gammaproteobacteria bacterium]|nr:transcriptional regulator [Gammaproteobacteria bacterium]MYD77158.1 transcriptional regulator [Gammaproteobacteria bacterium]MYJ53179.1 transcriptional regulator [Gammaproteobacteria bacterium]
MNDQTVHPEPYHYVECGLPNVWLTNGFERHSTPYGQGVSIHDILGLHKCIAKFLCDKTEPLTGQEFKFLRREMDFSQQAVGELFGVQPRQIRNVEKSEETGAPYNLWMRHIYLESIDPRSSLVDLMERLRSLDMEWHQNLAMKSDESGAWMVELSEAA